MVGLEKGGELITVGTLRYYSLPVLHHPLILNFLLSMQMLNIKSSSLVLCRVYGNKVAELPLVGTRFAHRRQGMCHLLMDQLEMVRLNLRSISLLLCPDIIFPCVRSMSRA